MNEKELLEEACKREMRRFQQAHEDTFQAAIHARALGMGAGRISEEQMKAFVVSAPVGVQATVATEQPTLTEALLVLVSKAHGLYEDAHVFNKRLTPILRPAEDPVSVEVLKNSDESEMRQHIRALEHTLDALSAGIRKTNNRLELP